MVPLTHSQFPFDDCTSKPCPPPRVLNIAPHPLQSTFNLVELTFDDLKPYESVNSQYAVEGITFEGAIAIEPSNPVFSPQPGQVGLIPTSGRTDITVHFKHPQRQVSALVIGARQVKLTAYRRNRVLAQVSQGDYQYLASDTEQTKPLPTHQLDLIEDGITKVVIDSAGPFVMNTLSCATAS